MENNKPVKIKATLNISSFFGDSEETTDGVKFRPDVLAL